MIRGIERRKIFWNKKDREDFLDRLGKLLPETPAGCYGWAFLSNIKIPLCEERRDSMGIYDIHYVSMREFNIEFRRIRRFNLASPIICCKINNYLVNPVILSHNKDDLGLEKEDLKWESRK